MLLIEEGGNSLLICIVSGLPRALETSVDRLFNDDSVLLKRDGKVYDNGSCLFAID